MATIKEFEEAAEKLTLKQLLRIKHSLSTLLNWGFFKKEYGGSGLGIVHKVISRTIIEKTSKPKTPVCITIDQAKNLMVGEIIYHLSPIRKNADGSMQRWKVNGQVKTWKRNLNRIQVPLKHGLYTYGYLTEENLSEFTLYET